MLTQEQRIKIKLTLKELAERNEEDIYVYHAIVSILSSNNDSYMLLELADMITDDRFDMDSFKKAIQENDCTRAFNLLEPSIDEFF